METTFEKEGESFLDNDIYSILQKYSSFTSEANVLKELINSSYLIIQQIRIQYYFNQLGLLSRQAFLSSLQYATFDINHPNYQMTLDAMHRLSSTVRVLKYSKVDLNDFLSVETTFSLSTVNNTNIFIGISFLRHNEVLYENIYLL